ESKFGKKGARKRISPEIRILLEGYFLAGNISKSNRYTAQDMYDELVQLAQEGKIKMEEVPKSLQFKTELVVIYVNISKKQQQRKRSS
ncbi:1694_t:CDS:1, partial [Gigaspora margarita]